MSEAVDSKKRNRKHYGGMRSKRQRVSRELDVGMQGILITCNMNERKCTSEAYNLLNEYADKLFGPEKVTICSLSSCSLIALFEIHLNSEELLQGQRVTM